MNSIFIILFAAGGILLFSLFVNLLGKGFTPKPASSSISATKIKSQERKTAQDTENNRRKAMEDMQQRIKDQQRHF